MVSLGREDILIWYFGLIQEYEETIDRDKLKRVLGLRKNTIGQYLSRLKKAGILTSLKGKKDEDPNIKLSQKGEERFIEISEKISTKILHPSENHTSRSVHLTSIMGYLRGPYEKVRLLDSLYIKKNSNIQATMGEITSHRKDSISSAYMKEVQSIRNVDLSFGSLNDILGRSSIYNSCLEQEDGFHLIRTYNIDDILLQAEILRRNNVIDEAKCIYCGLLRRNEGLEANRWLLCFSGMIHCMIYENEIERAIELLDEAIRPTTDPIQKAFLKKIKADIIQDLDRFDEASMIYKSCLGSFQEKKFPLIRSAILNNLGVLYMRKGEDSIATGLWEDALKIARKQNLPWMISMASINLADAYSLNGSMDKGMKLLGKARTVMKGSGDGEGLSAVDFNMALVQIEKGDLKRAWYYFNRSKEFPLSYRLKIEERERVFKERLKNLKK